MQHSMTKRNLFEIFHSQKRDMFPANLPDEMEETLTKIEVLLEYGHIKDCFEELLDWVDDTPKGSAYEEIGSKADELYRNWTTYALFNREVLGRIDFDNHVPKMKAFITRQLDDPETRYERINLLLIRMILD